MNLKFKKETDINAIRDMAKVLCRMPVKTFKNLPFICSHPFTTSIISMNNKREMIDLSKEEDFEVWVKEMFERFDKFNQLSDFFMMLNSAYYLTFLNYIKEYMSEEDFGEYLAYSWVAEENPNGDANVPTKTSARWFKAVNKKYLMSEEEYQRYEELPEQITVYRGVSEGRKKLGLSWTTDYSKALWFANRFGNGYLLSANINKKHALAYLLSRGEKEVVVDIFSIDKSQIIRQEI